MSMIEDTLPAYEERQNNRSEKSDKIKSHARSIIKNELKDTSLSVQNYLSHYQRVDEKLRDTFDYAKSYRLSRLEFLKYIREKNNKRSDKLPEPALLGVFFRKKLILSPEYFQKGSLVASTVPKVKNHWQYAIDFNLMDALAWCIYSAIIYGGLNHKDHLEAFFQQVLRKETPFRIVDNHLLFCLDMSNSHYGYRVQSSDNARQVMRSIDFVLDDVTALWLIRLKTQISEHKGSDTEITLNHICFSSVCNHLMKQLQQLTNHKINFLTLLKHGSFYQFFQIDSYLNPLLLQVMQHRATHYTTSVSKETLLAYFEPKFRRRMFDIDPTQIYQLTINASGKKCDEHLVIPKLRRDMMQYIKYYLKHNKIINLQTLLVHFPQPNHQRLLTWTIEKSSEVSEKSVRRYLSEFAEEWLSLTFDEDFEGVTAEEYRSIYQQIICKKPEGREFFAAQRLKDFHAHLVSHYNAPMMSFDSYDKVSVVKAELVSPTIYAAMLQALNKEDVFKNPFDQLQCQCLMILAYRSGMRVSELVALKTIDFSNTQYMGVFVKSNQERKLKTDSAKRYLPLWVLLNAEERRILSSYITIQRQNKCTYAFSRGNGDFPISTYVAQQLLKSLANALLSDYSFSFHSLRHTLLSNLAMVLFCETSVVTWFTDYSEKQIKRIRFELLGKTPENEHYELQSRWMALSAFAGHLSVDVTLRHYLHTVYMIAGFARTMVNTELPAETLVNITNLSQRRLSDRLPDMRFSKENPIKLHSLRLLYSYELSTSAHRLGVDSQDDGNPQMAFESVALENQARAPLLTRYPRQTVLGFLSQVEAGMSLTAAAMEFNMSIDDGRAYYEQAVALSQLTNTHGKPRLFAKNRQDKLIPSQPKGKHANNLINVFFDNAFTMQKKRPDKLTQFMQIFLGRVTPTKASIRFPKKEQRELNQFIKTGMKLLGGGHWCLYAASIEEAKKLKKRLNLPQNVHIDTHDYTGYAVTVVQPLTEDAVINNRTYRSLGVLKYVCHVWLLLDADADAGELLEKPICTGLNTI